VGRQTVAIDLLLQRSVRTATGAQDLQGDSVDTGKGSKILRARRKGDAGTKSRGEALKEDGADFKGRARPNEAKDAQLRRRVLARGCQGQKVDGRVVILNQRVHLQAVRELNMNRFDGSQLGKSRFHDR